MHRKILHIVCAFWFTVAGANAAPLTLADFKDCDNRPLVCYKYVAEIRETQLTSEDQLLYVERGRALLDDWKAHREHRLKSLWAQYVLTWILLGVAILIVLTGLAMSWLHMRHAFMGGSGSDTALEAGAKGLRMSSPVIGLFVFGASMWFFSVYIDKIYKLSVLADESRAAQSAEDEQHSGATVAGKDTKSSLSVASGAKGGNAADTTPAHPTEANTKHAKLGGSAPSTP